MFANEYRSVANTLVGKTIRLDDQSIQILETQGYSRKSNQSAPYTPVTKMRPGQIFCPRHRGGLLVLVACHDRNAPGGCVLIRKIQKDGRVINGPGRVARALGITEPETHGIIKQQGDQLAFFID